MLWFCGFCLAFSLVVLAGRAHSRYLDRLDAESDQAWYVVLSGRANTALGCQAEPDSRHLLLTPASPAGAGSITLTFAQSDMSARQSKLRLAGDVRTRRGSGLDEH